MCVIYQKIWRYNVCINKKNNFRQTFFKGKHFQFQVVTEKKKYFNYGLTKSNDLAVKICN